MSTVFIYASDSKAQANFRSVRGLFLDSTMNASESNNNNKDNNNDNDKEIDSEHENDSGNDDDNDSNNKSSNNNKITITTEDKPMGNNLSKFVYQTN